MLTKENGEPFVIGLPTYSVGENSYGAGKAYIEWIEKNFGAVKFLSNSFFDPHIDLLIIPGGPDVNTLRYGEMPGMYTGRPCIYREWFDHTHLPRYIELGIPIFGICRGLQTLAVHCGAKLIQNMWHPTNLNSRSELKHFVAGVNCWDDSQEPFQVNSLHHQVVSDEGINDNNDIEVLLRFCNTKKEPNKYPHVIEACRFPNINAIAVQWHPEEIWDEFSYNAVLHLLGFDLNDIAFAEAAMDSENSDLIVG